MVKDGQEAASMFLDGNRTRVLVFSRDALTQLSDQFDNQSTAAHPKKNDRQAARWVVNRLSGCTGFEPACGTRPLLPITQTQRPVEIGVTNRIRTGTNAFTGRDAAVTS